MKKLLFLVISIFSLTILGCMPEVQNRGQAQYGQLMPGWSFTDPDGTNYSPTELMNKPQSFFVNRCFDAYGPQGYAATWCYGSDGWTRRKISKEDILQQYEKTSYKLVKINKEQPISIGEEIYSESVKLTLDDYIYQPHTISYTYVGLDDKNNVKIIYKYEFKPIRASFKEAPSPMMRRWADMITPKVETFPLLLPLNPKKQTMLKVKSFEGTPISIVSKKELIITVVDELNRITAEEIRDTQTK